MQERPDKVDIHGCVMNGHAAELIGFNANTCYCYSTLINSCRYNILFQKMRMLSQTCIINRTLHPHTIHTVQDLGTWLPWLMDDSLRPAQFCFPQL